MLPALAGGGAEVQMAELLRALPDFGIECELVTLLSAPVDADLHARLGVEHLRHTDLAVATRGGSGQGALRAVRNVVQARSALAAHLRRSAPQVVYSRLWYAGVAVASLNRRAHGFAHVANEENALSNLDDAGPIKRQARVRVIAQADRWVVPTHGLLREFVGAGAPATAGRVIHNATPLPAALPPRCGGAARFAAMGRLVPAKGFDRLIDAAAQLRDGGAEFTLDIAGEGPERAALMARITALRLDTHVRLVGFLPDPLAFLLEHDAFVLASRSEGFANVLAEAMACGLPTVAFDIDYGPSELIVPGETGLLIPDGDGAGLVHALKRLATDPELRARYGDAGRAHATRHFSVASMAEAFAQTFHDAAALQPQKGGESYVRHPWYRF